jgi:UDP-N-acetylmuramoyl-tripeptide--D-alanyl-D-alanine ligase
VSALWTSDEVACALAPAAIAAPFEANGVTFDSRAVAEGDLFFALKGETTDGHAFVGEALKRGAAAAVVSRDVAGAGDRLIRVPDTMKALVDLGRAGRRRSAARIASVTGSVGKTSTKDALRVMLSAEAATSASAASFNNHVGVPISLARLPREARYGVFEIGMNHPGEIEPLARQVEAHVGVVTNVGPVHIGHMGSEEAIADEKGCLFAGMAANGAEGAVAVLNRDSRHYDRLAGHARRFGVKRITGFGRSEAAEARLLSCDLRDAGSDVVALIHGRRIEYRLGAAGEHWVLNSIAALAVVEALGADVERAAASLSGVGASPGRGARRTLRFGTGTVELLDESYNANPVSMRAMLAVLARTEPAAGGRRLLAMGDMRELGEGADAYHAGLADAVAASGAAQVFLCGPHMQALWRLLAPAQRGVHRPDSASLAGEVAAALRAGDVIAVKGSLGSKMKTVVDAIVAASGGETGR